MDVKWVRREPTRCVFTLLPNVEDGGRSIRFGLGEEVTASLNRIVARYGILKRVSGSKGFLARPKERGENMGSSAENIDCEQGSEGCVSNEEVAGIRRLDTIT
jgi:hypothetical protein